MSMSDDDFIEALLLQCAADPQMRNGKTSIVDKTKIESFVDSVMSVRRDLLKSHGCPLPNDERRRGPGW